MRQAGQTVLQADYRGIVAVLEFFFRELMTARDVVDVHIAAGAALHDLEESVKIALEHVEAGVETPLLEDIA